MTATNNKTQVKATLGNNGTWWFTYDSNGNPTDTDPSYGLVRQFAIEEMALRHLDSLDLDNDHTYHIERVEQVTTITTSIVDAQSILNKLNGTTYAVSQTNVVQANNKQGAYIANGNQKQQN